MRRSRDFYETPQAVTRLLMMRLGAAGVFGNNDEPDIFFEPCVGNGAISEVIEGGGGIVKTNDIDPKRRATYHQDAGERSSWERWPKFPFIISNLPASEAHRIIPLAFDRMTILMAMLIRITFMEPVKNRRTFLKHNPPQHQLTTERISFRKNKYNRRGTDSVTTAWYIWTADRRMLPGILSHEVMLWKVDQ